MVAPGAWRTTSEADRIVLVASFSGEAWAVASRARESVRSLSMLLKEVRNPPQPCGQSGQALPPIETQERYNDAH